MTDSEHGAGVYSPDGARRDRRRRKLVAGISGLAVVLGVGAFYATGSLAHKDQIAPDAGALTPFAPADSPTPTPTQPTGTAAATRTGLAVGPSWSPSPDLSKTAPSATASPKSAEQEVRDAREAAAKDGVPLMRPRPTTTLAAAAVTATDSGSLKKDGTTLRLVSARGDLTGQRELGWVAGGAKRYGDATCSQTMQFANNEKPKKIANLLICWRTSATRSVATVMVNVNGHPSRAASVAALDKRWKELG
jgi:hypothetical protein